MPKSMYVDPKQAFKKRNIKFKDIPVCHYDKSIKDELDAKNFTKADLIGIYADMVAIREFETMLMDIKLKGVYNQKEYTYPGPSHLAIGEEATAVGQAYLLGVEDFIFGTHRSHHEVIAKGLSAINTVKSISNIDLENMTSMPVVDGKSSISGFSGAAVKPIGLRFCAQMLQNEKLKGIPISGIGGIETWRDALEFMLLGCRNVQVTTGVMQYGYRIVEDMINGLSHWMDEHGFDHLDDFIGKALGNIIPAEDLNRNYRILPKFDYDKCVGCGRCYVSCYDGGHQAIDWDAENRKPVLNKECVGCHLCLNVCPIQNCITPGELVWKEGRTPSEVKLKSIYE